MPTLPHPLEPRLRKPSDVIAELGTDRILDRDMRSVAAYRTPRPFRDRRPLRGKRRLTRRSFSLTV
jgi:hypothetical protein